MKKKNARYFLKYGDDEPGVRRPPFWRPYWRVTHLTNYGFKINREGRKVSQRIKQKTDRWIDTSSYVNDYSVKKRYFERMKFLKGEEMGIPNQKLSDIGLEIYKNLEMFGHDETKNWLGVCGAKLSLEEVVNMISLYSLVNPDSTLLLQLKYLMFNSTIVEEYLN